MILKICECRNAPLSIQSRDPRDLTSPVGCLSAAPPSRNPQCSVNVFISYIQIKAQTGDSGGYP